MTIDRAKALAEAINPAQHPTIVRYSIPQTNRYSLTDRRSESAWGYGVEYLAIAGDGRRRMIVWRDDIAAPDSRLYGELNESLYLIDNGKSVEPFYVAGWSTDDTHNLYLHSFPTGPRMTGWSLSPRKAFHVKVTGV